VCPDASRLTAKPRVGPQAGWETVTSCVLLLAVGRMVYRGYDRSAGWFYLGIPLILWLIGSLVLYLYYALAGGIISRDERQRRS
jgi:hypothetical protein